jgi:hypothetical protein
VSFPRKRESIDHGFQTKKPLFPKNIHLDRRPSSKGDPKSHFNHV